MVHRQWRNLDLHRPYKEGPVRVNEMPPKRPNVSTAGSTASINEVGESLLDRLHTFVRQVDIHMSLDAPAHGPAAQVVQAENGIRMSVRQQHGIDAPQAIARKVSQRRLIERLSTINQNRRLVLRCVGMASHGNQGRAKAAVLASRLERIMARHTFGFVARDTVNCRDLRACPRAKKQNLVKPLRLGSSQRDHGSSSPLRGTVAASPVEPLHVSLTRTATGFAAASSNVHGV